MIHDGCNLPTVCDMTEGVEGEETLWTSDQFIRLNSDTDGAAVCVGCGCMLLEGEPNEEVPY